MESIKLRSRVAKDYIRLLNNSRPAVTTRLAAQRLGPQRGLMLNN